MKRYILSVVLLALSVTAMAQSAPSLNLVAEPGQIQPGQSVKISWSSCNAAACVASDGWVGNKSVTGEESFFPTADTRYTLTCTGPGGYASQSLLVNVIFPAVNLTLSASPGAISTGQSATLAWSSANATACTASSTSNDWTGLVALGGTVQVTPTATTTYTLNCTGQGAPATKIAVVQVNAP